MRTGPVMYDHLSMLNAVKSDGLSDLRLVREECGRVWECRSTM